MARNLRQLILDNAAELRRLHALVRETYAHCTESREARDAWLAACAEFHARYDALAFPGGYEGVFGRLMAGDRATMEATLVFLELRPYFFRSGYMHKKLLRYAKRAPFGKPQAMRLRAVMARAAKWRAMRRAGGLPARSLEELYRLLEHRGFVRAKG